MEVGQAVLALDLVDAEADLAEGVVLILLEIGEGDLDDAALESVVGVLETGGAVHQGLADTISSFCQPILSPSCFLRRAAFCRHRTETMLGSRSREVGGALLASVVDAENRKTHSLTLKGPGACGAMLVNLHSFLQTSSDWNY